MAFDDSTRARLREFVSDARTLLTAECTRQLQHEYGMDPATGEAVELSSLPPLDDTRWETARILRDTLAHYLATSPSGGRTEALQRIVREQAFTILNRLVALRMMEARGLLLESLARGYQSRGFQLYQRLAGSSLGETGDAYRCYLASLFDEFALDLTVLFDRFSPQGRLFPYETALLELLGLMNHPEIEPLWAEDETIGWIYQYYNSQEERRQMRADSAAPRNSRELAVRNQFFTPRYVVEFLTENTLGRLWYEMTKGQTVLAGQCRHMVRRPHEVFLQSGQETAAQEELQGGRSQEELLERPVYIPFRALKDPRNITMLDPACGSMHFGLYAFDLYERIYDEAWELDGQYGTANFIRSAELKPLHDTYLTKEAFLCDVPRLIIEHNIHGIDIDPRAVQIAGLSLWLRAQRSWQAQGIKSQQRPKIQRANVVCAEPMPGEKALLKEFTANLQPRVLGQLVEHIFDQMQLAGEAGALLKIEEELQDAVEHAREEFNRELLHRKEAEGYLIPEVAPQREPTLFDFADLPDRTRFWNRAEQEILVALKAYAEQAEGTQATQKRLFAQDTVEGFSFIDLCRKQFDVVLMNPPFGEMPITALRLADRCYPQGRNDVYAAFVLRALTFIRGKAGIVGVITSRSFVSGRDHRHYRRAILSDSSQALDMFLDLGGGVLDGAVVETCAYTIGPRPEQELIVLDLRNCNKPDILTEGLQKVFPMRGHIVNRQLFTSLPMCDFLYDLEPEALSRLATTDTIEPTLARVTFGLTTKDDFRFVRLRWEVLQDHIGPGKLWSPFAKGGEYSWFTGDTHLLVKQGRKGTAELAAFALNRDGNVASTRRSSSYYYRPAVAFSRRSQKGFSARRLRPDACFSDKSGVVFPDKGKEQWLFVLPIIFASEHYQKLINSQATFGSYEIGPVKRLPCPSDILTEQANMLCNVYALIDEIDEHDETTQLFVRPPSVEWSAIPLMRRALSTVKEGLHIAGHKLDQRVERLQLENALDRDAELESTSAWLSYLVGTIFGRWDIRYATGDKELPELPAPFDPLPVCPQGMLQSVDGLPAEPKDIAEDYPLCVSTRVQEVMMNQMNFFSRTPSYVQHPRCAMMWS
ncbi:MAG: BREX-1 system adenine-specific DNA-methyltransferase PglX [Candidatus Binatia bacterium]